MTVTVGVSSAFAPTALVVGLGVVLVATLLVVGLAIGREVRRTRRDRIDP